MTFLVAAILLLVAVMAVLVLRLCVRVERLEKALNAARRSAEGPAAPVHAEGAPRRTERNTGASR